MSSFVLGLFYHPRGGSKPLPVPGFSRALGLVTIAAQSLAVCIALCTALAQWRDVIQLGGQCGYTAALTFNAQRVNLEIVAPDGLKG